MTCARTGSVEAVRGLLAYGADAAAVDAWHGQTALMWAAGEGHADVARVLIEHGADVDARSKGGFTALLIAVREDVPALVGHLVAAGADVNAAAPDGATPLHVATVRGHAALATTLLEHGADPNADGPGYTALHWAGGVLAYRVDRPPAGHRHRRRRRVAFSQRPARRQAGSGRRVAGPRGRPGRPPRPCAAAVRLCERALRVNLVGATPFLLAAMDANVGVMRRLAAAGADTRAATDESTTPLMVAAGAGAGAGRDPGDRGRVTRGGPTGPGTGGGCRRGEPGRAYRPATAPPTSAPTPSCSCWWTGGRR